MKPGLPLFLRTEENVELAVDAIAQIYDLPGALDPITTPPHKVFLVVSHRGENFRCRADVLRGVFGTKRRRGVPVPVGGVRPQDVK